MRGQFTFTDSAQSVSQLKKGMTFSAPKRSMSNGRLIASTLAIMLGIFLSYCSLFYLPAFAVDSKILRMSSESKVTPQISYETQNKSGWFTPYLDLLRVQRGYMHNGSHVEAVFVVSEPSEMTFIVTQCQRVVLMEIFKCTPIDQSEVKVQRKNSGIVSFTIPNAGFYYVSESIQSVSGAPAEYSVIWRRK
ncbi:hypothetical protein [Robiginitomaculum antarcticum]|uniref:hypothetical protein n=1 Tax=Robiginitomaculum antarcticum TaxID=437507 RepID=UPI00039C6598|nr:hypothetical protein [Robiginitomaculum antarcticum]